jgi:hypothetical protein
MMDFFNSDCFCVSLDRDALRRALEADPAAAGISSNVFAALPVFVAREQVDAMARVIRAVEEVVALPAYRAALAWMPEVARFDPGARGVFMGYDFHIGAGGPKLIEINTNAGGALLNAILGRAQRACCDEVAALVNGPLPSSSLESVFREMFLREWRLAGRAGAPSRIVILDDRPEAQFLYPEFLLFAQLFRRSGIEAEVLDPSQLVIDRDTLVYNRLTDFSLSEHAALRQAYLAGEIVVTPHPRAHALYADKRNLTLLSNPRLLRAWGASSETAKILESGVARTRLVMPELWSERRKLFFKPATGYGSKAAYRGEKITRRVWEEILAGEYVAQEYVAPGARRIAPGQEMKVDVRNYVYAGEVQLLAARLYQGQTTNLRTAGGGFAPVLTPAPALSAA